MSEDRAFVAMFPSGDIRWVIDYSNGGECWMFPPQPGEETDKDQLEWMRLWGEASKRIANKYLRQGSEDGQ